MTVKTSNTSLAAQIKAEQADALEKLSTLTAEFENATSQLEDLTAEHEQLTEAYAKVRERGALER